jgi:hypothetical protein
MQPTQADKNEWQNDEGKTESLDVSSVQPTPTSPSSPMAGQDSPATYQPTPKEDSIDAPDNPFLHMSFDGDTEPIQANDQTRFEWDSVEFIDHPKTATWFLGFMGFVVVVLGLSIFLLKDWFVITGAIVMCVAFWVVGMRKPRTLHYALDNQGLHIAEKLYPYDQFRFFSILPEGQLWSAVFVPNGRFSFLLTIYFTQADGEEIVDVLNEHLPMEEYKLDYVDHLAKKIHF